MYNWLMLLAAFILVGFNALFVAAEFAFVRAMRVRIELAGNEGDPRAKHALFGLAHLDAYLSVCQLGITLASLGLGWIGEPAVSGILTPIFAFFNIDNPVVTHTASFIAGFGFITFLHVIFGELAPKTFSIQFSESTALFLAKSMRFFYFIFFPFVKILNGTSNKVLKILGLLRPNQSHHSHTPEELQMLIVDSERSGFIEAHEQKMLSNVFRFDRRTIEDIMIHRMDTVSLSAAETVADVIEEIKKTRHTRFPVYKDDRDNIIGFINIKDLVGANEKKPLKSYVRPPFYAFESMYLDDLMLSMQKHRQQFAIVLDEYGGWQGIVTMEDMLEVIVGDLKDEHDIKEPKFITKQQDGKLSILANTSVEDLYDYLGLKSEEHTGYSTVAGLFLERAGSLPETGAHIIFYGYKITVSDMDGKRIKKLEIEKIDTSGTNDH